MPIKGQSKTAEKRICRLFQKNCTYWWKNLDRCWTRRIFALRSCSVEEINSSSVSWKPTSRKRRSDWILENQRPSSEKFPALSSLVCVKWKKAMAGGGGNKNRYQYCRDSSGTFFMSELFKSIQDAVLWILHCRTNTTIPDCFFKYIYHVGCAINLHSIINAGLIPGGQSLSNRQTVFFLLVDLLDKNHKDPDTNDLNATRHAQYMHKAWKRHQNTVYWVDVNLAIAKGLKFYQTRSNAIILFETLPVDCILKVVRMEIGEVIYEKVYVLPRPPPKISFEDNWTKEMGSEVAQRPEGQVGQQFQSSQSNQPIPNTDRDRTEQPVVRTDRTGEPVVETGATLTLSSDDSKSFNVENKVAHDRTGRPVVSCHTSNVPHGSQTHSSHESTSFNVGDETIRDRTGQPVVNRDETGHEQTMLNEVNMDFRIPGLPHSVVKQAENSRVRQLVKKIQNHPDRHTLQLDLQQNKAYNPLSTTSKQMIKDVGKRRAVWVDRDGPQDAVQSMLIILEWRHRLLHMRSSLERNCGQ